MNILLVWLFVWLTSTTSISASVRNLSERNYFLCCEGDADEGMPIFSEPIDFEPANCHVFRQGKSERIEIWPATYNHKYLVSTERTYKFSVIDSGAEIIFRQNNRITVISKTRTTMEMSWPSTSIPRTIYFQARLRGHTVHACKTLRSVCASDTSP